MSRSRYSGIPLAAFAIIRRCPRPLLTIQFQYGYRIAAQLAAGAGHDASETAAHDASETTAHDAPEGCACAATNNPAAARGNSRRDGDYRERRQGQSVLRCHRRNDRYRRTQREDGCRRTTQLAWAASRNVSTSLLR